MKFLVISDIHSRAETLKLVPEDEDLACICLGDICAGDPTGSGIAIDWLMEHEAICVMGSHDLPVVDDEALERYRTREETLRREGRGNPDLFRRFYNDALRVRNGLSEAQLDFISSLPDLHTISCDGKTIHMIHNSLDTELNRTGNRIVNTQVARYNFDSPSFTGDILLVGHSHIPLAYRMHDGEITETIFSDTGSIRLVEGRYIMNPGSLQRIRSNPRHNEKTKIFQGEERVSYGILDLTESTYTVHLVKPR